MAEWKNWSGWVKSNPTEIARPDNEDYLRQVLAGSAGPLRVVGTGHSFNALAATQGTLVDLSKITGLVSVSDDKTQATIRAGTPIHQLGQELFAAGAALLIRAISTNKRLPGRFQQVPMAPGRIWAPSLRWSQVCGL